MDWDSLGFVSHRVDKLHFGFLPIILSVALARHEVHCGILNGKRVVGVSVAITPRLIPTNLINFSPFGGTTLDLTNRFWNNTKYETRAPKRGLITNQIALLFCLARRLTICCSMMIIFLLFHRQYIESCASSLHSLLSVNSQKMLILAGLFHFLSAQHSSARFLQWSSEIGWNMRARYKHLTVSNAGKLKQGGHQASLKL